MKRKPEELARNWIKYVELGADQQDHEWFRYADELISASIEDPEYCWKVIKLVSALSKEPWVLENLGAGPFENILSSINVPFSRFFNASDDEVLALLLPYIWTDSLEEDKVSWLSVKSKKLAGKSQ